jgi:hypothetical protein
MRSFSALALSIVLASALAGCTGTAGSSSVTPSGRNRTAMSNCTPDSYGYCVVLTSHTLSPGAAFCPGHNYRDWIKWVWELYYNDVDQGAYTDVVDYDTCTPVSNWSPGEPSVVTGDPNLP